MISRVAVLPHPPLLVPELVAGDDADVTAVRSACLAVAKEFARDAPRWVVVGAGAVTERIESAAGTFRGFGVDVRIDIGPAADRPVDPDLPLPALVAGWLGARVGVTDIVVDLLAADLSAEDSAAAGAAIAARADDFGLLVLGDGSHRHGDRAVGRPDDRAEAFDAEVAAALASVDLDALLAIDPALADELGAAGRVPWQALAGAVRADGRPWRCARSSVTTPFGVAYHLALWEPVT